MSFLIFTILSVNNAERLQFKHGGTQLSGHHFLPYNCAKNNSAKAVIIFVHGDGDVTYDANGYYRFIWKYLKTNGYAIFSWDKSGTGKSEGNRLEEKAFADSFFSKLLIWLQQLKKYS